MLRIVPNMATRNRVDRRVYIGDQIDDCINKSDLVIKSPFERVQVHTDVSA